MNYRAQILALLLAATAGAQQGQPAAARPPAAQRASNRLQQQLQAALAVPSVEFEASWRWPTTVSGSATTSRSGGNRLESISGRLYSDALSLKVARDRLGTMEILQVGRHTITRENDAPWALDGMRTSRAFRLAYLPDPQRLLLALVAAAPIETNREIVEVGGRAVERVGATLDGGQVDQLVRAGALHDPNPMGNLTRRMRGGARALQPAPRKDLIDLVVEIDVATRHAIRVKFRAVTEQIDMRAAMERMRRRRAGEAADEEAPEPAAKTDPARSEMRYEQGMPVRPTDGKTVHTLELTMTKHGQLPPLELSEAQQRLLGR